MRSLSFGPSSATDRDYELCYQSLLFSPLPVAGNERKSHGELLDKMEKIGVLDLPLGPDGKEREYTRVEVRLYRTDTGGTIDLTEAEYELVKRHVSAMADAPQFPKVNSRAIDALIERLDKLTKLDSAA